MTQAIFLSYASQDADAARAICEALRAAGLVVWFDQNELRGGDAWDASIRKQIKECTLFVPIISNNTQAREEGYFRLEWKLAVDRSHLMADDKAFFFPVVLDGVSEPDASVPDKFRERQWTRLDDDGAKTMFAERIAKLITGRGVAGKSASNTAPVLAAMSTVKTTTKIDESPSIAVLAFANRSANADDEYFSDGLADELLNVLSKIKGLRVAARTSAFSFKGKSTTAAEIGRLLSVSTLLEGSVRKSGNRVRVAVQLVNVADGFHLWSESYDRALDDIFAVQDDIAQSVVSELRSRLMIQSTDTLEIRSIEAEVATAAKGRSQDSEAHRLYLQARFLLNRHARADISKSIEYLRQALAIDPTSALLWATLSTALTDAVDFAVAPVEEGTREALEAAQRALALEPDLVNGHTAMCHYQTMLAHDWQGALQSVQHALAISPEDSGALTEATRLYFFLGRMPEALQYGERAVEQDPLNAVCFSKLAMPLGALDRLVDAENALRKALELSPGNPGAQSALAFTLERQGRHAEALIEANRESADWAKLRTLSILYFLHGNRVESDRLLKELIEGYGEACFNIAAVFAVRGERDRAFEWLERGHTQGDSGLAYVKASWTMRSLHEDPRWPVFLQKMGLAD